MAIIKGFESAAENCVAYAEGEQISGLLKEFPDFPANDAPAVPEGFFDSSWHNNVCPSYLNQTLGLRVWIDYAEKAKREMPEGPRFILQNDRGGQQAFADLAASDDWSVIVAAIEARRNETPEQMCDRSEAELAELTVKYQDWMQTQGLALGSADVHVFDESLTKPQRDWLRNFCDRWEESSVSDTSKGPRQGWQS